MGAKKPSIYIFSRKIISPPLILRMYGGKKEISIEKNEKSFFLMSYFWFSPQNHQTEKYTYTSGKSLLSFNIFSAILGHVNPGDEVIIIEPYFDCYEPMVKLAGGVPRFISLKPVSWKNGTDKLVLNSNWL